MQRPKVRWPTLLQILALVFAIAVNVVQARAVSGETQPSVLQYSGTQAPVPWSTRTGAYVSERDFLNALAAASIVILGEVHDNPLHHELRGDMVREIVKLRARGRPSQTLPAAVFEHITTDAQSDVDRTVNERTGEPLSERREAFFKASRWQARSWPSQVMYVPLVEAVLATEMPVYAGDVDRATIGSVMKLDQNGSLQNVLPPEKIAQMGLAVPLPTEASAASLNEIEAAHCGLMPTSALKPMALAQRLRDATLADRTLTAAKAHGAAILFTGNGHVRNDRGVPWYLRQRGAQNVVTVAFKERQRSAAASELKLVSSELKALADFIIWTPERQRPDPCLKLREKFRKSAR